MSNKNYLQDLFINEAKPALKRHSGSGGGGGSSRLVECESLPTENVDEDKIYLVEWTETIEHPAECAMWMTNGDGSKPYKLSSEDVGITATVDSLDNVTEYEEQLIFYTGDGKLYVVIDGTAVDMVIAIEFPGEQMGYINSPDEMDPNALAVACLKKEAWTEYVERHKVGVADDENLQTYSNGTWNPLSNTAQKIIGLFNPPMCFRSLEVTTLEGCIAYEDTSNVTDMVSMFSGCSSLTTVPLFDTSNVTYMEYMFNGCSSLTTVPLFDTSNVTSMNNMFSNCSSLTTVPLFDTSNVTKMGGMFNGCSSLTTVPLFDTSNVIYMREIFRSCSSLTTVPLFDTSNVIYMVYMFCNCEKLTTVPLFDTRNVTEMGEMLAWCKSLTTVPSFDMRNCVNTSGMLSMCYSLTECWLRNIKATLQVGTGTSWGHLLTVESLTHLIYELRDTGSSKTLTVGSANLDKLASVYVKTVEITDEMRAEDDLIDEKLPFVVCESTDEGAMLIEDYVNLKHWNLA